MTKLYLKLLGFFAAFGVGMLGFQIVGGMIGTASTVASVPGNVVKKTLQTDNVIHKYEWFHDVYTQQKARYNQIQQFSSFLSAEEDKNEKQRLRMEMAAQQMSCRDLVAKYNANSEKMNVSIFKGWSLPDALNMQECEV